MWGGRGGGGGRETSHLRGETGSFWEDSLDLNHSAHPKKTFLVVAKRPDQKVTTIRQHPTSIAGYGTTAVIMTLLGKDVVWCTAIAKLKKAAARLGF